MLGVTSKPLNEKFLLLDIAPKGMSGVLLAVDSERNLIPKKIWNKYPVKKLLRTRFGGVKGAQLVVSADPSLATTISLSVELKRDPALGPLELPELEDLLSQT